MTKKFINKVIKMGCADTRKYRYRTVIENQYERQVLIIERIPLKDLDTTAALNGWETARVIF